MVLNWTCFLVRKKAVDLLFYGKMETFRAFGKETNVNVLQALILSQLIIQLNFLRGSEKILMLFIAFIFL